MLQHMEVFSIASEFIRSVALQHKCTLLFYCKSDRRRLCMKCLLLIADPATICSGADCAQLTTRTVSTLHSSSSITGCTHASCTPGQFTGGAECACRAGQSGPSVHCSRHVRDLTNQGCARLQVVLSCHTLNRMLCSAFFWQATVCLTMTSGAFGKSLLCIP